MSPPDDITIRTDGLTRKFGSFVAVDRVSFSVHRGEIFGLLGANGAGKTTTIRMLTGLLRPSGGEGWVAGIPVHDSPEAVKPHLGYMSQKFSLYEDLTVSENITFFGGAYGLSDAAIRERREELLELFDLTEWSRRLTSAIPTGHRQRLALASALVHRPRLLFLDEPTGGVDPVARRSFWRVIAELSDAGTTVLVTTHYMDEAEYCQRLGIMRDGELAALGSPAQLRGEFGAASIEEVFMRLAGEATGSARWPEGVSPAGSTTRSAAGPAVGPAAGTPTGPAAGAPTDEEGKN
ncbi:ABC transporter ATP-binding protein [Gemmatimonadota bacterium]